MHGSMHIRMHRSVHGSMPVHVVGTCGIVPTKRIVKTIHVSIAIRIVRTIHVGPAKWVSGIAHTVSAEQS